MVQKTNGNPRSVILLAVALNKYRHKTLVNWAGPTDICLRTTGPVSPKAQTQLWDLVLKMFQDRKPMAGEGLGCTQKADWKGICPMLNAGQGVILPWLPMWKESPPAKVKGKDDQACLKGSGRYMGMLESEWGNWAFPWEKRKPEVRVCSLTDTLTHRVCTHGQSSQVQVSSSVWSICEMFRLLNVYVISG